MKTVGVLAIVLVAVAGMGIGGGLYAVANDRKGITWWFTIPVLIFTVVSFSCVLTWFAVSHMPRKADAPASTTEPVITEVCAPSA